MGHALTIILHVSLCRYVFPDFLPDPTWHRRDRIREKLERQDMLNRRAVMDIPEFYVGELLVMLDVNIARIIN